MRSKTTETLTEVEVPVGVVTKAKMEETLVSLRSQYVEAQTRATY